MQPRQPVVESLAVELAEADLGDTRLDRRLVLLATSLADRAAQSFPNALDDAELEAAYRFFGNERVTPAAILAPHFRQSAKRCGQHANVLVVHDTTQFEFGGASPREGLGRLVNPGQGSSVTSRWRSVPTVNESRSAC